MNSEGILSSYSNTSMLVGLIPRESPSEEVEDQQQCVTTSNKQQSTEIAGSLPGMSIILPMLFTLCHPVARVFRWRYKSDYFDQIIRGYDYLTDCFGRSTLLLGANKVLIGKYIRCSLTICVPPPNDPSFVGEYYSPYKFLTGYPRRENFRLENPMSFQVTQDHIDETRCWIKLNLVPVKAKQRALLRKMEGSKKKCPTLRCYPSGDQKTFPGMKPRQLWQRLDLDTMNLIIQAGELDEHGNFIVDSSILTTYIGPITGCTSAAKTKYFREQQPSSTVVPFNDPGPDDNDDNDSIGSLFGNATLHLFDNTNASEPKIGVSTMEYNYTDTQHVQQPWQSNAKRTIAYLDEANEPSTTKAMKTAMNSPLAGQDFADFFKL